MILHFLDNKKKVVGVVTLFTLVIICIIGYSIFFKKTSVTSVEKSEFLDDNFPQSIGEYSLITSSVKNKCEEETCADFHTAKYQSSLYTILVETISVTKTSDELREKLKQGYGNAPAVTLLDGVEYNVTGTSAESQVRWRISETKQITIHYEPVPYEETIKYTEEFRKTNIQPTVLAEKSRGWPPITSDHVIVKYFINKYPSADRFNDEYATIFNKTIGNFNIVSKQSAITNCYQDVKTHEEYCLKKFNVLYQHNLTHSLGVVVDILKITKGVDYRLIDETKLTQLISPSYFKIIPEMTTVWHVIPDSKQVYSVKINAVNINPDTFAPVSQASLNKENAVLNEYKMTYPEK
jgi:hypothetical protein